MDGRTHKKKKNSFEVQFHHEKFKELAKKGIKFVTRLLVGGRTNQLALLEAKLVSFIK